MQALSDYVNSSSLAVAVDWLTIAPHDDNNLLRPIRAIRANTAGTVAVICEGSAGATRTLNFLAGETRYGAFIRVLATGTTATGLEGGV